MALTIPLPLSHDDAMRFVEKIRVAASGCWLWTGALSTGNSKSPKDHGGYPEFWLANRNYLAHRVMYTAVRGPIAGVLDHVVCETRHCIHPWHTTDTTNATNVMRGNGIMAQHARKTHCKRGHALSGRNLVLVPGGRMCRTCRNLSYRWYRQRKRDRLAQEKS